MSNFIKKFYQMLVFLCGLFLFYVYFLCAYIWWLSIMINVKSICRCINHNIWWLSALLIHRRKTERYKLELSSKLFLPRGSLSLVFSGFQNIVRDANEDVSYSRYFPSRFTRTIYLATRLFHRLLLTAASKFYHFYQIRPFLELIISSRYTCYKDI